MKPSSKVTTVELNQASMGSIIPLSLMMVDPKTLVAPLGYDELRLGSAELAHFQDTFALLNGSAVGGSLIWDTLIELPVERLVIYMPRSSNDRSFYRFFAAPSQIQPEKVGEQHFSFELWYEDHHCMTKGRIETFLDDKVAHVHVGIVINYLEPQAREITSQQLYDTILNHFSYWTTGQFLIKHHPVVFREEHIRQRAPSQPGKPTHNRRKVMVHSVYHLDSLPKLQAYQPIIRRHISCPAWSVRWHYRRLPNGKVIWVKPHMKGRMKDHPELLQGKEYGLHTQP